MTVPGNVSRLLKKWADGDDSAGSALVQAVYARLVDVGVSWQNRAHFYALAARMTRRLLVTHAKARTTAKRGGGALRVTIVFVCRVRSGS